METVRLEEREERKREPGAGKKERKRRKTLICVITMCTVGQGCQLNNLQIESNGKILY